MMIITTNALFNHRFYSVTGAFNRRLTIVCFYRYFGNKTRADLAKQYTPGIFTVRINRTVIDTNRSLTALIPIAPLSTLTAPQLTAVSSLKDYPTPAR